MSSASITKRMIHDLNRVVTIPATVILQPSRESGELSIPLTWIERAIAYYLGHQQMHELMKDRNERALIFASAPIIPVHLDDYYAVAYEYRS